jgi:hypothetical protein
MSNLNVINRSSLVTGSTVLSFLAPLSCMIGKTDASKSPFKMVENQQIDFFYYKPCLNQFFSM